PLLARAALSFFPRKMPHEGRKIHRGGGKPPADYDVCTGIERRNYGVGAQIGIHADDLVLDRRNGPRLVHKWMIGAKAAADVIALDAGDPQAGDAEIARDLMRAR